jgi:hypothetical protein
MNLNIVVNSRVTVSRVSPLRAILASHRSEPSIATGKTRHIFHTLQGIQY